MMGRNKNNINWSEEIHPDIDGNFYMSIGGNCVAMACLGPNRIKGPVDNVRLTSIKGFKYLFNNLYTKNIIKEIPKIIKRTDLNGLEYLYSFVSILHNNPLEEKYRKQVELRYKIFNNYLHLVQNSDLNNYYFVYSLSLHDIDNDKSTLVHNVLKKKIKLFKKLHILDKIIFIGSIHNSGHPFNYHLLEKDLNYFKAKYNIKYITMTDIVWENTAFHVNFINKLKQEVFGEN